MQEDKNIEVEIDPGEFRKILGHYPTGVCVITGIDETGAAGGLVMGSFTSVSLDPPMVSFCPDKGSSSWPKIRQAGRFCVNVVADDQLDLCRQFATSGGDKFAGVAHRLSDRGMPILDDVVAWIDCKLETEVDAGDHTIVLGRVEELRTERAIGPLLFHKGGYGRFVELG